MREMEQVKKHHLNNSCCEDRMENKQRVHLSYLGEGVCHVSLCQDVV